MAPLRALEAAWTRPSVGVASRRPSWLSPAAANTPLTASIAPSDLPSQLPPLGEAAAAAEEECVSEPSGLLDAPDPSCGAEAPPSDTAVRDVTIRALSAELETLRATASELAVALVTAQRRVLEASEGALVRLALDIAAKVVAQRMDEDPTQIVDWARDAIATLPVREALVVALSPDLAERIAEPAWNAVTEGMHRLEVDATLAPATCEIRATSASIEVSAAGRLAAIGEAIGAI